MPGLSTFAFFAFLVPASERVGEGKVTASRWNGSVEQFSLLSGAACPGASCMLPLVLSLHHMFFIREPFVCHFLL